MSQERARGGKKTGKPPAKKPATRRSSSDAANPAATPRRRRAAETAPESKTRARPARPPLEKRPGPKRSRVMTGKPPAAAPPPVAGARAPEPPPAIETPRAPETAPRIADVARERAPAAPPRLERRPKFRRPDPRDRGVRGPGIDRGERGGGGQAAAINRSRPLYPEARRPNGRYSGGDRYRAGNGGGRPPWKQRRTPNADGGRVAANGREAPDRPLPPLPANPREAALRILHAVDTRNAFSDRMLEGAHAEPGARTGGVPERDQGLLHELVKGTLRWRGRVDWALDGLVHIGLERVQPWIKNILRLGAYEILFLDRIPAHASVDESVKLAHKYGHPGTAGLVNSVLRRLDEAKTTLEPPAGDDPESLATWGSHPLWLVERWLDRFDVEDTRALMLANNRAARVGLRVNRLRLTREQLLERLAAEGVSASPGTFAPDLVWLDSHHSPLALRVFREGLCTAQDESESLVARLVAPERDERVLDTCAAPGGKSTHMAELMGDEGEVWALERAEARIPSLEATVARMAVASVHVVHGDGRTYPFPMPFDRVLVDAPCSGLGVLARRADARWRKGPEILSEMPPIQLELLAAAGRRARPGGVVVYSVCSFEPEETTHVVERFLRQNPAFVLETAHGLLPDEVVDESGFLNVLPHVHGCDGAFAARFRKT